MLRRGGIPPPTHVHTASPCMRGQGRLPAEGEMALGALAAAPQEREPARPPALCSRRRCAGDAEPGGVGARRRLGQPPWGRLRVSTAPRSAGGEGGGKFGSPSSRVGKVPASSEGSAVPPPLPSFLPSFLPQGGVSRGWLRPACGRGAGGGRGAEAAARSVAAEMRFCPPPPPLSCLALPRVSRKAVTAGFSLGKWLCLFLSLTACSGGNLFSCSSPELMAAFEVCKHARLCQRLCSADL